MKQLLFIATLIFNMNLAIAQDVAPTPIYGANFSEFEVQHEFIENTIAGSVRIDLVKQEIEISLQQRRQCPTGMNCIALAPAPTQIKLPIVDIYDDWCGSTTYLAEIDNTPIDGMYEAIEVRDYSTLTCRILMPYMTVANYTTRNPWTNESVVSSFRGNELRILPQYEQ